MDAPTITTSLEAKARSGAIILAFGTVARRSTLDLHPLYKVLWQTLREPCIVTPWQSQYSEGDSYRLLLGVELLANALSKQRHDYEGTLIIGEDTTIYEPRHPFLASERIEMILMPWHDESCDTILIFDWWSLDTEEGLRLVNLGLPCPRHNPSQPCRFALRLEVTKSKQGNEDDFRKFINELAADLRAAYETA